MFLQMDMVKIVKVLHNDILSQYEILSTSFRKGESGYLYNVTLATSPKSDVSDEI